MERARATLLLEQMLERLDAGGGWPLELVQEVYVFGSYARGALRPHDVDVAVEVHRDERLTRHIVSAIMYSRNPYSELRQALAGRSRGLQIEFESATREQLVRDGALMLRVWKRGDSLAQARAALHAIKEDPDAGRAPRHDMIDAFDGLDRYIPRGVRQDLISWQTAGTLTITRLELPDPPAGPLEPYISRSIDRRWSPDSPLRRAALAALAHLRHQGVELDAVELAGQRLPTPARMAGELHPPRWWANWKWQHYRSIPYCLGEDNGAGWLEIPRPTRTRPLEALLLTSTTSTANPEPRPAASVR